MTQHLVQLFPQLGNTQHAVTSPPTPRYNCFAWAGDDDQRWWQPIDPFDQYYWPEAATRGQGLQSVVEAYQSLGYAVCDNGELEPGLEKVAVYSKAGSPTHAAKQLPDGTWSSKLGELEDISHTLEGIESPDYGSATTFLSRPRT